MLVGQFSSNSKSFGIQYVVKYRIWSADNPVEVLNKHLLLLVECFIPTKVIRVGAARISLGLMINAGMLLASSRRLIFSGPEIAHGLNGSYGNLLRDQGSV